MRQPAAVLPPSASPLPGLALVALFSLSLLTSAALMFSVQPMVGKMLLPIVGGATSGWIVAMAFFQLALLAGYTLAYGFSRLSARGHALAYLLTLALGGAFLPIAISAADTGGDTLGAGGTFLLLAASAGVPFVALSTSSTTLQRLFAATRHPNAHDPYFLYAASNFGSFAGLLLYPFLVEPALTIPEQSRAWLYAYAGLGVLALACACAARREGSPVTPAQASLPAAPLTLRRGLYWLAAAFIPASLLMGYTSFITRDIYSAPLIWVFPLAIYLLTFVVAFRSPPLVTAARMAHWHIAAVVMTTLLIALSTTVLRLSLLPVLLHLVALGIIALTFHLRLYEDRPLGSARQLGAFYLLLSLGGALAGIFNAFVAPVIFDSSLELPVVLLASLLLHPALRSPMGKEDCAVTGFMVVTVCGYIAATLFSPGHAVLFFITSLAGVVLACIHPRALLVAALCTLAMYHHLENGNAIERHRNFYGTIAIFDTVFTDKKTGEDHPARTLMHGTTLHGMQFMQAPHRLNPTSYYGAVIDLFDAPPPATALVMGLGVGTMNCLAKPQTAMSFIEIDPAVIDAARRHFSYLSECGTRPPRILQGDGRLELAKLDGETFDLIAVDVFSSDYIPAHLMTREALALYTRRLADDGVLLFHISNIFFDLAPVLATLAEDAGLSYRLRIERHPASFFERPSIWFAMARTPDRLKGMEAAQWATYTPAHPARLWTDDYTDYLGVLIRPGVSRDAAP